MSRKYIFICTVVICSLIISAYSVYSENDYKESVTENALSLISIVISDEKYEENREELVKNLLTFTALSNESEEMLLRAVANDLDTLGVLSEFLMYFEYNDKSIKELENMLKEYDVTSAIKLYDNTTAEMLALKLVNDIYGGVAFEKHEGNGDDFLIRYLCSNICIDVLSNDKLRYLCDIEAISSTDLFKNWLLEEENAEITAIIEENGILREQVTGNNIEAMLCIDTANKRIIAAEITLKY